MPMSSGEARQHLERKLRSLFPEPTLHGQVERELARYGQDDHEREPYRVRLAILKLAGADAKSVREYVDTAKSDFRDVLAWAESPYLAKAWAAGAPKAERMRLQDLDRQEYTRWLEE